MKRSPRGESQQTCPMVITDNLREELYIQGDKQMTAKRKLAGAAPTQLNWQGINWPYHKAVVKKLQVRIAKAVLSGRWGKVKSLQHLLTSSFSAKILAVKKVTQNKGRNTAGVDGVIIKTPRQKAALLPFMKKRSYQSKPLRRIYIKKKNGKLRPLSIPTVFDRCMQQLHYQAVLPVSETTADGTSYGFRAERNCADAIEDCFNMLSRGFSPQWVLEGDIKGCFDNISHQWLQQHICMDKTILKKWLKAGFIETKKLFPTKSGTPQGGIISPCLANMALDGVDEMLDERFGKKRPGIHYIRYADDFVVTAHSPEKLEEIRTALNEFLKERGLELSQEKTKITHISKGFDFLGQNVRKYPAGKNKHKLLIKPSRASVQAINQKIRDTIHKGATWPQASLITKLNPIIRGWVNYHRSVVSKVIFHKLDRTLWSALWKWAIRRHPKKNKRWILNRYFVRKKLRNYCFNTTEKLANGAIVERNLCIASYTPIIRHTKIRRNVNIYSATDEAYFEKRKTGKMRKSKTGRDNIAALLKRQNNLCPCCGRTIEGREKWVVHPITSRLKGGEYLNSNLCVIHNNCHDEGFKTGFVYNCRSHKTKCG